MTDEQLALARQLRPLHLPEPISAWPPAPGWWVLSLCGVLALLWWGARAIRRRRRDTVPAICARQLDSAYRQWQLDRDSGAYLRRLPALLRRVAIRVDGRQAVARLTGRRWIEWLDNASTAPLDQALREWLATLAYRSAEPELDVPTIHRAMLRWARHLHA